MRLWRMRRGFCLKTSLLSFTLLYPHTPNQKRCPLFRYHDMWVQGLLRISWKDTAQGPRPGSFCGWWSLAALVRTLWMLRLTTAAPFLLSILPRLCRPTEWHWQLSIADVGAIKPCLPCTLPSAPGASQPAAPTQTSGDPPAADFSQMRVTRNTPLMCMAQMELWAFPRVLLPLSQVPLPAPALVWLD